MVLCTGDLVEHNVQLFLALTVIFRPEHNGFQSQLRPVKRKIPYITATRNHDYSIDEKGIRSSRFPDFFQREKTF
jgi:hypothetical protein